MNLIDINWWVSTFIDAHSQGIATVHSYHFHNNDELSLKAFRASLVDELRTGCVTFINKIPPNEDINFEELDSYLFYIVNAFGKQQASPKIKKKTNYLCPACLFLGQENSVYTLNKLFKCDACEAELKSSSDPKRITLFRAFFKHNKSGYHCGECSRFIPHPLDDSPVISCPYLDCCFVGPWISLKRMHHPTSQSNIEVLTLDANLDSGDTFKNLIPSDQTDQLSQLENLEALENKISILKDVIDSQKNNVPYSSSDATLKHKYLSYEAFNNLLKKFPAEMVAYLLENSRSGGFQHKVFQEYIRLLEASIPFSFKKNDRHIQIESLLDKNLSLFDGISVFEGVINNNLEIKNGTKEFYIGGRKGSIARPYYIGKLLSVNDKYTKAPLIDKVIEYSFSKIKMRDVPVGTEVIVSHLRVPPHYQMGGMVYINRVRKKIIDRAVSLLNKDVDE